MEQMEPHGRLSDIFMHACEGEYAGNLAIVRRRQNRGEVDGQIELLRINLSFLHWQIRAQSVAMRMAIARFLRRLAVACVGITVVMTTAIASRLRTIHITVGGRRFMVIVPAAPHHCVQ